jgi:ATP-dependent RNA helicase SUPV3L1/SUV3
MSISREPAPVTAILGPTNTGKTHYAIERMLAHSDGMIGLPLRLLAREVYDRIVKQKGAAAVALITGEEKIAPDTARYFVCTVEAMPLDRRVQFLAVDEIQLARDPDRGHVFTSRILSARGAGETLLLGSDTMRPMLHRLIPRLDVQRRERLSTLSYSGPRKLTKLAKRTAIVAFSTEEVYAIAELIRRQRGGAAVVMGALSPRTRNAQVGLYQSGEVDFLVATDAIGMGLNMDVDHVAFAARTKFDGRRTRMLRADEVGQIAGRAGRFRTDGTFGETGECPIFNPEIIERVEAHEFESVEAVEWRNPQLDFSSLRGLIRSLERPPERPGLMRARGADDEETLKRIVHEDFAEAVTREQDVRRVWDACLTPDFRKVTIDEHARLVAALAKHLLTGRQRIPQDWIGREVGKLDRTDGDLDSLQARLAHIRTWTYAANRPDWIDDCEHWRGRTREIEDKLSDSLHALLTQRFIDRRTSALLRGLKKEDVLVAAVSPEGEVSVEGHFVGRLEGLDFRPDPRAGVGREGRALRNAAQRALAPEVARRLKAIAAGPDEAFELEANGRVRFAEAGVARLASGSRLTAPRLTLIGGEAGEAYDQRAALERMEQWLAAALAHEAAPLVQLEAALAARQLVGAARGLAFLLVENVGAIDRPSAEDLVAALTAEERKSLAARGVRLGRHTIYLEGLHRRPGAARLLSILRHWTRPRPEGRVLLPLKRPEPVDSTLGFADYAAIGWRAAGPVVVRIDRLERFAHAARRAAGANAKLWPVTAETAKTLGLDGARLAAALAGLGYKLAQPAAAPGEPALWRPPRAAPMRNAVKSAPATVLGAALAGLAAAEPPPRKRRPAS